MSDTPTGCPALEELERAIEAGPLAEGVVLHVAGCVGCAERARVARENVAFLQAVRRHIGSDGLVIGRGEPPAPEPVPALPNYQFVREIGRGAQGVVYEAVQVETRRRVAVKVIGPVGASDVSAARRFRREAEVAAGLRHPHIVTIYHTVSLADGRLALAMEFVDGVPLDEWAAGVDAGAGPTAEARRQGVRAKVGVISQICAAVHHAHSQGVIHRDLKPGNVLVERDGTPRVVDFGIARRLEAGTQITRVGGFVGTLAYAAPEQVSSEHGAADTRSDVYALGLLLYETLTGRRPYDTGSSLSQAIESITRRVPSRLVVVRPGDVPAGGELEAIASKALAKEPDARYQSAAALRADLEHWLSGRPVEARQQSTLYMLRKLAGRHRPLVAVGAGVLVLLGASAAALAWSNRRLADQRTMLAESLSRSTVDRGLASARAGENVRAEGLLWPEFLAAGGDASDPRLLFESSPAVARAAWALVELSSRHPLRSTMVVGQPAACAGLDRHGGELLIVGLKGERRTFDVGSQALVRGDPAVTAAGTAQGARWVRLSSSGGHAIFNRDDSTPSVVAVGSGVVVDWNDPALRGVLVSDVSADGQRMLTLPMAGRVELWESSPMRRVSVLTESSLPLSQPRLSHDDQVAHCGEAGRARLWDGRTGALVGERSIPAWLVNAVSRASSVLTCLSADGRTLAVGFHGQVLLYDAMADGPPTVLAGHRGFVAALECAREAGVLLSAGNQRTFQVWDLATREMTAAFEYPNTVTSTPALSGDGSVAAVLDSKGVARVYETRSRRWRTNLGTSEGTVHSVRFSPDGRLIASAGTDGRVRAYRVADGALAWETEPRGTALETLAFSPDGTTMAVSGPDGVIDVVDARDGASRGFRRLAQGSPLTTWMGYHPDGKSLVEFGQSPDFVVIDAATGGVRQRVVGHGRRNIQGSFSRDGATLYAAGSDVGGGGGCIAFNTADWSQRFWTLKGGTQARAVAVSADGSMLALGTDDWEIHLCDARTGEVVRSMNGVRQHVFGLAFHPAGHVLFSCGRDREVQVWDTRTGAELGRLDGHRDIVLTLALSPDGQRLATGSTDRTTSMWDLDYYRAHLMGSAGYWAGLAGQGSK